MTSAHRKRCEEAAKLLKPKLGCDCDYCEGLVSIDEGGRCMCVALVADAIERESKRFAAAAVSHYIYLRELGERGRSDPRAWPRGALRERHHGGSRRC